MANLETISIEISANSQKASQGIAGLIGSLRSMSKALGTAASAATSLNNALKQLQRYSKTKLPNINQNNPAQNTNNPGNSSNPIAPITPGNTTVPQGTGGGIKDRVRAIFKGAGSAADEAKGKVSNFSKSLSQIGRIAKTMLIRTAIRSLIKGFSEAWQSAYKFSKAMGGDFAKNIDKVKASLKGAAVSIVSALAPAMNFIAPIINVMANAIKYLCDMLKQLMESLGITSELFGASVDQISAYGSESKNTAKDILASFDELNVINSGSGGSGGSGGSTAGAFTSEVTDELAKLQVAVGEATMAIGLILAFTGHVPLGVGLIAIGAAAIVKTVVNDWGKLTQDTKNEIATIMTIVGAATLALGAILAFTGHIGLGVGLIAMGAANLVAVVAIKDTLSPDIKKKITKFTAIIGGSLLAIGAILCFTGAGIPLGIGLMLAGAANLAAAVALNWDAITSKIKTVFGKVTSFLTKVWGNVSSAVTNAWESVKTWASATWSNMSAKWEKIKEGFAGIWEGIKTKVTDAWNRFLKWKNERWTNLKAQWENIKTSIGNVWTNIKNKVIDAWNMFLKWKNERWENLKAQWENIKNGIANAWTNVKNKVIDAWNYFLKWKNERWANLKSQWENIKNGFKGAWDSVKKAVSDAWSSVTSWIGARWNSFSTGWSDIQTRLVNVWLDIKSAVGEAWDKIKLWWDQTSSGAISKIKEAWVGIKDWFYNNITKPIGNFFKSMVNTVIGVMNFLIRKLNSLGHIKWDEFKIFGTTIIPKVDLKLFEIKEIAPLAINANGAYDIPAGQLFMANEAGPELVGKIGNHNSVVNNDQIVESVSNGVARANSEQNALLREQNTLLRGILAKESSVRIGASSALGKTVRQSLDMYGAMTGGR